MSQLKTQTYSQRELQQIEMKKIKNRVILGSIGTLLLIIFLGSLYTIEQGYRGVVLRFGEAIKVVEPGIHLKIPFADNVRKMSVRTHKMTIETDVYSSDIQAADITISLNYSLNPGRIKEIYSKYFLDYEERVIRPQILARAKDVIGRYQANDIVQSRIVVMNEIRDSLFSHFEAEGIIPESIQLENIEFSLEFEKRVEQRMQAEIDVATRQQNLRQTQIQAQMAEAEALGKANARRAEAQGESDAIRLIAEAEAKRVEAIAKAMNLNSQYVEFVQANKWNGVLPSTVMSGTNGVLPIIGK